MTYLFLLVCLSAPVHALPGSMSARARRRLDLVNEALQKRPWVFVDGNNVLGTSGWRYRSAELTGMLDGWALAAGLQDRVVTVWDSSDVEVTSCLLENSAAVFSSARQLADDVIVQGAGYTAGPTVVFSSDKALQGRCLTQRRLSSGESDTTVAGVPTLMQPMQSQYLTWILDAAYPMPRTGGTEAAFGNSRAHRRREANELSRHLQRGEAVRTLSDVSDDSGDDRRALTALVRWFDSGSEAPGGLSVERTSRAGNLVYAFDHTLARSEWCLRQHANGMPPLD